MAVGYYVAQGSMIIQFSGWIELTRLHVELCILGGNGCTWLWVIFCVYHGKILVHHSDIMIGVIASQITSLMIVYSTIYSGADQGKHQSSASLVFVWGIHRGPGNSRHKRPVTRKMFPFDNVIMQWEKTLHTLLAWSKTIYRKWTLDDACKWNMILMPVFQSMALQLSFESCVAIGYKAWNTVILFDLLRQGPH